MADPADNIQSYRQILELDDRSRVLILLAEELCATGEWEEAAAVCKKGLLFYPDHLRSQVLLGWALMEMGDAEQSGQILLNAAEDIRKNSIIFKLLSELAAMSGKTESAGEYARIYDAFQTSGPALGGTCPPGSGHSEPVPAPKKEASDWDDFKAEALEKLEEPGAAGFAQDVGAKPEYRPEDILTHIVQRIEGRVVQKAEPVSILSEDDKNMLKERIVALLEAQ